MRAPEELREHAMTDRQERLAALRRCMGEAGYDALIVPRADEYLGEYIPAHNERLRWVSGFTGSAGAVLVLADQAAIFVDGRYTVQVRREVESELYEYHHLIEEPYIEWMAGQLSSGARVACDPRLHSLSWYRKASDELAAAGIELIADTDNLVDRCWEDRPAPIVKPALLLGEQYTGESSAEKRQRVATAICEEGADAALIFAPDAISWLLNIRGTDIPCLPVVQGFGMLEANGEATLFVSPGRVPPGLEEHVGAGLKVLPEDQAATALSAYAGRTVLSDPDSANAWTQLTLEQGGATLAAGQDPVLIPNLPGNRQIEGLRNLQK
jgi:Xaa-Pro aminopeptidase